LRAVEELARLGAISVNSLTPAALAAQSRSEEWEEEEGMMLGVMLGGCGVEGEGEAVAAGSVEDGLAGALAELRSAEAAVREEEGRVSAAREAARQGLQTSREARRAARQARVEAKQAAAAARQAAATAQEAAGVARREEERLRAAQAAARAAAAEYAEWTVKQARRTVGVGVGAKSRGSGTSGGSVALQVGEAVAGASATPWERGRDSAAEHTARGGHRRSWEFLVRSLGQAAEPEQVRAVVQAWAPIDAVRRHGGLRDTGGGQDAQDRIGSGEVQDRGGGAEATSAARGGGGGDRGAGGSSGGGEGHVRVVSREARSR
jgi:hypothetical protein